MVKTWAFTAMDPVSIPVWGTKIPQAMWPKNLNKIKNKSMLLFFFHRMIKIIHLTDSGPRSPSLSEGFRP